ncbi:M20/M25/M40 family metallo-hydrolase [Persicimonas caeni]|uniref:M20/M25/M40 family metallo-hydrolase n=1 Tax=Persicimonas caeni TaxID=2292766 RepID=A0A4Y6PWI7_PERCE|nr:M20/M25/M40 family metallo-hydrolase [Persicimonas caeni]QDG52105.1 M20/M25/M40 family metallo-hydrolase [Persicimonas caeni]QED33326.1 M20/M25/M40 family metallo-hydrolase [Persicimonas caeni]
MTTSPYLASVHDRIGGIPEVMGPWQLELLLAHGLDQNSTVVDIGCGTLRGGLHVIRHLEPGRYVGVDPLAELVEEGRKLVREAGLADKNPVLGCLSDLSNVTSRSADFVLTQSVLNHLGAEQVEATVARVASVLADDGKWLSTGRISEAVERVDEGQPHPRRPNERLDSVMGRAWFERLLSEHGLVIETLTGHPHPRGLDVFCVQRLDSTISARIESTLSQLLEWDTSPDGADCQVMAEWLESAAGELGFDTHRFGDAQAPLLIFRRSATGGGRGRVVMYNHYDVDHIEDGWNTPPLNLTQIDERWYGLGVADNKGVLAARLEALRDLDRAPEIWWLVQGEEESGSQTLRRYLEEHGLPDADWFLDENGKTDAEGSQRLLTYRQLADGKREPLTPEDLELVRRATRVAGEHRHVEVRPLNKALVPGGCAFQAALPAGSRYVGLGSNDGETRIHAPNESIPIDGAVKHWIQVRALLDNIAANGQ